MFGGDQSENAYALGHAHSEIARLTVQAHMFEPFTRQFFVEAGMRPGCGYWMWAVEQAMSRSWLRLLWVQAGPSPE